MPSSPFRAHRPDRARPDRPLPGRFRAGRSRRAGGLLRRGTAALLAAVTAGALLLATAPSANATSTNNCAWSENASTTCLDVYGSGLNVVWVEVTNVGGKVTICNYKVRFWGTGGYWESPMQNRCVPGAAWVSMTIGHNFPDGSLVYGQFYANGHWLTGSPATRIHR
ncbi:hypothetical protein [Kitasatospora sp. NPDC059571]|uniref:hypothetical protein n=1 Tax=Kitasatospora sp. NPDC059571 TaxID=3346871 RepID=UPI0036CF75C2